MTYDREVEKWPAGALEPTKRLYETPGRLSLVVPTSQEQPREWTWTTSSRPGLEPNPIFDAPLAGTGTRGLWRKIDARFGGAHGLENKGHLAEAGIHSAGDAAFKIRTC